MSTYGHNQRQCLLIEGFFIVFYLYTLIRYTPFYLIVIMLLSHHICLLILAIVSPCPLVSNTVYYQTALAEYSIYLSVH